MKARKRYPRAVEPRRVGRYAAEAAAGGGFVWDAVLEYRVWCHPKDGGEDYYYAFASYPEAVRFRRGFDRVAEGVALIEEPIALVLQREYIDEPTPGKYVHVKKRRVTEWPVEFLSRPRRTKRTIPKFFAPDAPRNRLAILRGRGK